MTNMNWDVGNGASFFLGILMKREFSKHWHMDNMEAKKIIWGTRKASSIRDTKVPAQPVMRGLSLESQAFWKTVLQEAKQKHSAQT